MLPLDRFIKYATPYCQAAGVAMASGRNYKSIQLPGNGPHRRDCSSHRFKRGTPTKSIVEINAPSHPWPSYNKVATVRRVAQSPPDGWKRCWIRLSERPGQGELNTADKFRVSKRVDKWTRLRCSRSRSAEVESKSESNPEYATTSAGSTHSTLMIFSVQQPRHINTHTAMLHRTCFTLS